MDTTIYTTIVTTGFIVSTAVAGGCIWHLVDQKRKRKQQELMDIIDERYNSVCDRIGNVWDNIENINDRLNNVTHLATDMKDDIAYMKEDIRNIDQRITDEISDLNRDFDANSRELENMRNEVTDMVMRSIDNINTDLEQWKTEHQHEHDTLVRDNGDSIDSLYRYVENVETSIRNDLEPKNRKIK